MLAVGPRRSGKTYLLYQIIQDMIRKERKQEEILYINFEDERLIELKFTDLDTIIEVYKELYARKPVIFFDEIQNVEGWEKFLRRLADQKYRIYVSGSNAKLLSREMASVLGGRFLILEMYNLSFREYLRSGAFPEVIHFKNKKAYFSNLFQKVFYGDDIFYFRDKFETDFYLPQQEQAIQVSYSLSRPETMKREILGLKSTLKARKLKEGTILTYDEEDTIMQDGFEVHVIPVWKWLLRNG